MLRGWQRLLPCIHVEKMRHCEYMVLVLLLETVELSYVEFHYPLSEYPFNEDI